MSVLAQAQPPASQQEPNVSVIPRGDQDDVCASHSAMPLANVPHESMHGDNVTRGENQKIELLKRCITVHAEIVSVEQDDLGETVLLLRATDPADAPLNARLGVIAPADMSNCTVGEHMPAVKEGWDYGVCSGAKLAPPEKGAKVVLTGALVQLKLKTLWKGLRPASVAMNLAFSTGTGNLPENINAIFPIWEIKEQ